MDVSQLSKDWSEWVCDLQQAFPHVRIPSVYPRAALGDAMVERIAHAHELTQPEVREMIGEMVLKKVLANADGTTPIRNLYHTGAAVWPGGGTGAGPGTMLAKKLAR